MPFRKKNIGTGMTARVVLDYVVPESPEAVLQEEQDIIDYLAQGISRHLKNGSWSADVSIAKAILSECGLPNEAGMFADEDGRWIKWGLSDDCALALLKFAQSPRREYAAATAYTRMPEYSRFHALSDLAEVMFGYESVPFFAAQLVSSAHHINLAREAGLYLLVESLAFDIGHVSATWELKVTAERSWAIGQKALAGGMKGAETKHGTAETREAKRREIEAIVAEGVALGLKLTPARHRAAKKLGVSYSTIRRAQSSH